ncbi:MAG: hypothetical protein ACE5QV_08700, partial [Fidelibacterota bacterium]
MQHRLRNLVRNVQNFPVKGIGFKDITTLLKEGWAFREAIDIIGQKYNNQKVDLIAGIESRGFIIGAALVPSTAWVNASL